MLFPGHDASDVGGRRATHFVPRLFPRVDARSRPRLAAGEDRVRTVHTNTVGCVIGSLID